MWRAVKGHAEVRIAPGAYRSTARGRHAWAVGPVLDSVSLIDLTRGDLLAAGTHAPLRSNDAIHLAVALRVGADEIVTYDGKLAEQATAAGLPMLSPGSSF
jgi:predicted nucleic acid-binding protein